LETIGFVLQALKTKHDLTDHFAMTRLHIFWHLQLSQHLGCLDRHLNDGTISEYHNLAPR